LFKQFKINFAATVHYHFLRVLSRLGYDRQWI